MRFRRQMSEHDYSWLELNGLVADYYFVVPSTGPQLLSE